MKFSYLALLPVLAAAAVEPFDLKKLFNHTLIEEHIAKRQSSSNVILTQGVQGSGVQPRLEIRSMATANQGRQLTLLLYALAYFQGGPQTDDTSYFGIAKVHGVPRRNWNGVGQCSSCQNTDGYCTHGVLPFPCWHRAYQGLFEQQFMATVQAFAAYWPTANDGDNMRQAASTMRFPYFDWALQKANPNDQNDHVIPQMISSPTVTAYGPDGQFHTMTNPLYSAPIKDPSGMVYQYFTSWKQTLRYPSSTAPNAVSQESQFVAAFDQNQPGLQDSVYTLLVGCGNYKQFSNTGGGGTNACGNSIEGIHNTVHSIAGGPNGHMTVIPEAAFDPFFWLHHGNVDRLFALWQVLNSDYSGSQVTQVASWTTPVNYYQDMNSGFAPLRQSPYAYWTCNTVRNRQVFNSDYDTFVQYGSDYNSIRNYVENAYGPNANIRAASKRDIVSDAVGSVMNQTMGAVGKAVNQTVALLTPVQASNGTYFTYFANVEAPVAALGGSYWVLVFDGTPTTTDSAKWLTDANLMGTMGIFSKMDAMEHTVSGVVPLTTWATKNLLNKGTVPNLAPQTMIPYFKKNLNLYVVGPDGQSVDPKSIDGLTVKVTSSALNRNAPAGEAFTPFKELTDVTNSLLSKIGSVL